MSNLLLKTENSEDENESFSTKMCIKIRKFLRLKDIHKVRDAMRTNNRLMCDKSICKRKEKQRNCKDFNNNTPNESDSEMSVMYVDTEDESGDEIDKLMRKQHGAPFEVYFIYQTKKIFFLILKSFIK